MYRLTIFSFHHVVKSLFPLNQGNIAPPISTFNVLGQGLECRVAQHADRTI